MKITSIQTLPNTETEILHERHRVLIVDDDPAILFAYAKLLEREGLCVDSCDCIHEAIRHIKLHPYLAVVTDMRLAGTENTDGLDVIRVLQKERSSTSFILATGSANKELENTVRQMGASHYFQKPVDPSLLLTAINDIKAAFKERKKTFFGNNVRIQAANDVAVL